MCVSTSPADFSATRIYVGEHQHPEKGEVEVLMYANVATNFNRPNFNPHLRDYELENLRNPNRYNTYGFNSIVEPKPAGPNCMILHIKDKNLVEGEKTPSIGQENFIDSSSFPHILDNMVRAVNYNGTRGGSSLDSRDIKIFAVGSYTVLLCKPENVKEGLEYLDESVRPTISEELIQFYIANYPFHVLALCCFNEAAFKSHPMIVWYERFDKDWDPFADPYLYFPAIDAHTGEPPKVGELVETDHWLFTNIFGGTRPSYGEPKWKDNLPWFVPENIIGIRMKDKLSNGDFAIDRLAEDHPYEDRHITLYRMGPDYGPQSYRVLQEVRFVPVKAGYVDW